MLKVLVAAVVCASLLQAEDVVETKSGRTYRGTILQNNEAFVSIKIDYGVMRFMKSDVASVQQGSSGTSAQMKAVEQGRLPSWDSLVTELAKCDWASGLHQIPATVIDVGIMRNVPYVSFRCGQNDLYEINIYGDLDSPACIEIGLYGALRTDSTARENCVAFMTAHVLTGRDDRLALRGLSREGARAERGEMTLETTPHTAPDAYGGWWVATYFERAVDGLRAKDADLAAITVDRTKPAADDDRAWSSQEMDQARTASRTTSAPVSSGVPAVTTSGSSGGSRVYVRGYYRKDGTYVHPHSRRR